MVLCHNWIPLINGQRLSKYQPCFHRLTFTPLCWFAMIVHFTAISALMTWNSGFRFSARLAYTITLKSVQSALG